MSVGYEMAPPLPPPAEPPNIDPLGAANSELIREQLWHGWATAPRSVQRKLGMSEIGSDCARFVAYKLAETTPVNFTGDPMPSLIGTGTHANLADIYARLDGGTGRYLIESPVVYNGIPGSVDLFDRRRKVAIDWKVTSKSKLRKVMAEGPPKRYVTQIHGYGAGLVVAGEDVERVAIVYLARDGKLTDLWTWIATLDPSIPDAAIARVNDIRSLLAEHDNDPREVARTPSRLCGWCPFFSPNASDERRACRGAQQ